jgi:hypothetical protein
MIAQQQQHIYQVSRQLHLKIQKKMKGWGISNHHELSFIIII